jgi:4-hydroxy 2-oxovalerate aldolase
MKSFQILDCTLRDGGYYTNWDFSESIVNAYIQTFNNLPIDYIEIGYRSVKLKGYYGKYFYCDENVINKFSSNSVKKIAVILNEKDITNNSVNHLLLPLVGKVHLIRVAIDPQNITRAIPIAESIKKLGFEVAFNVMYMSKWLGNIQFLESLSALNGLIDYFYMVDSYGGMFPDEIKSIIEIVKSKVEAKLGFHGHNNLEMALVNSITAIECGVEIIDSTVTGMGRGAGNLKTELLLTVLEAKGQFNVDFNGLSNVVTRFEDLQKTYNWGTNLPYMVSGANSLPQKEVMEWVTKRYYSLNSIILALTNKSKGIADNKQFPKLDFGKEKKYTKALIVGGGTSVMEHSKAIQQFLQLNLDFIVIHASSKNALEFYEMKNDQIFCLVGNEGYRLEKIFDKISEFKNKCILPPFPRKMGTYLPSVVENNTYELDLSLNEPFVSDSHTGIALKTALELGVSEIYLVGYDGYSGLGITEQEQELFNENNILFNKVKNYDVKLKSLTSTKYSELDSDSVYSYLF